MIVATGPATARVYWRSMGTWAIVRFLHVAAAAIWLGMQVALFVLVPALRRMLPPERVREVVRAAGMRLAIVAAVALPISRSRVWRSGGMRRRRPSTRPSST